jgi:hypothetical protein
VAGAAGAAGPGSVVRAFDGGVAILSTALLGVASFRSAAAALVDGGADPAIYPVEDPR